MPDPPDPIAQDEGPGPVPRAVATPAALEAIARLVAERGPVMFVQSAGCCDGSCPMCFDVGEFVVGNHDVLLGTVGGCPVYMDPRQFETWRHVQLIVDVEPGEPEGFSHAAGPGRHFVARSRVLTPQEEAGLGAG